MRSAVSLRRRAGTAVAATLVGLGIFAAGALSAPVPPAAAASNGSWSLFPYHLPDTTGTGRSLFDFSLKAGQSISDAFTLSNDTKHPLDFAIYPADAYDVSAGGGFALRGYRQKNVGVGVWVRLSKSIAGTYTLAPLTAATVPFTLTVPADASPGDHAGGIVALNVSPVPSSKSHVHFSVHQGVGVRIYLHVLGAEHSALELGGIHSSVSVPPLSFVTGSSKAQVRFSVKDTGNTLFTSVEAQAYATDVFGQTVQTFRPEYLAAVLPGSDETVTEPEWKSLPLAGPVTVHVQLLAPKIDLRSSAGFWVVPWVLLALGVAFVVALVLFVRSRRRRRRKGAATPEPVPDEPVEGEQVEGEQVEGEQVEAE